MEKIIYLKKIKEIVLIDNEPYDIYLALKDGKACYVDDMGYPYEM